MVTGTVPNAERKVCSKDLILIAERSGFQLGLK
jgi:hypothetical protein